jgi:acetyltransferase-like isoleucine patch superfamily enzyme
MPVRSPSRTVGRALTKVTSWFAFTRAAAFRRRAIVGPAFHPGRRTTLVNEGQPTQVRIGSNVTLLDDELRCYRDGHISIGDFVWMSLRGQIISASSVEIGSYCIFGRDVYISDTNEHPIDPAVRRTQTRSYLLDGLPPDRYTAATAAVRIGDGVWVGERAIILKGVTVGCDSVIAAGSVVTKDVPTRSVVAGNPARVVKVLGGA